MYFPEYFFFFFSLLLRLLLLTYEINAQQCETRARSQSLFCFIFFFFGWFSLFRYGCATCLRQQRTSKIDKNQIEKSLNDFIFSVWETKYSITCRTRLPNYFKSQLKLLFDIFANERKEKLFPFFPFQSSSFISCKFCFSTEFSIDDENRSFIALALVDSKRNRKCQLIWGKSIDKNQLIRLKFSIR